MDLWSLLGGGQRCSKFCLVVMVAQLYEMLKDI